MCIVCQIGTNVIMTIGLVYQPTQADVDLLLEINQRISQIQQISPVTLQRLKTRINMLQNQSQPQKNQYYLETLEWLIEYNQMIYDDK